SALAASISDSRGRRLAGDQSAVDARHHHRRFDPGCAGSGAGRSRNRQLARLRHRAAKLAAAVQTAGSSAAQGRSDAVKAAVAFAGRSKRRGGATRRAKGSLSEGNFTLAAGKALGVIGPTASGKSSLARMLVGVWRPLRGTV